MSIDPKTWTEKSQEAFSRAVELCKENSHAQVTPIHLGVALFEDENGLARKIAAKTGAEVKDIERALKRQLSRLPSQSPAPDSPAISSSMHQLLTDAKALQAKMKDSFLSVDHLLSACLHSKEVANVFKDNNVSLGNVDEAIKATRGGKTVDSKNAEETFEALQRYARDLVRLHSAHNCIHSLAHFPSAVSVTPLTHRSGRRRRGRQARSRHRPR